MGRSRTNHGATMALIAAAPSVAQPPPVSRVAANNCQGCSAAAQPHSPVASATAQGNWYHFGKTNVLLATLVFAIATVYFITAGKRGKALYIRPIGGISAVDEAIGRATEMGRPILFVLGTGTAGDIATIAGYTILARVARRTAEYQTPILVPVNDPVMMAMAQETVREAYLEAGAAATAAREAKEGTSP